MRQRVLVGDNCYPGSVPAIYHPTCQSTSSGYTKPHGTRDNVVLSREFNLSVLTTSQSHSFGRVCSVDIHLQTTVALAGPWTYRPAGTKNHGVLHVVDGSGQFVVSCRETL